MQIALAIALGVIGIIIIWAVITLQALVQKGLTQLNKMQNEMQSLGESMPAQVTKLRDEFLREVDDRCAQLARRLEEIERDKTRSELPNSPV